MTDRADFAPTTRSNVVSLLREEILTGRLPYGTRLRQAEIAARLGISTTPVREAFRELATQGLVEIHAHRGAVVHRPTGQEVTQIYEVRTLLEPVSVAWSAARITTEATREARLLLKEMQGQRNSDAGAALNRRFHSVITGACGNDQMHDLVMHLLDLSTPYIVALSGSSAERSHRQAAEHERIVAACERRDPAAAYRASLDHLARLRPDEGDAAAAPPRWLPFDLRALAQEEGGLPGQAAH